MVLSHDAPLRILTFIQSWISDGWLIMAHPAIIHCSHLLLKCSGYKYKSLAKSTVKVVQKLHICEKVYFDQLLDCQILLSLFLTLYYCTIFYSLDAGFFQYHPDVKQFGSRSGPTFCWAWSGSKLFAKVISRQQKSALASKELNTKQLVDTTLAKVKFIWLQLFSTLAKVLATTKSEQG